jgi:predicted Zn-dependent protease
MFHACYKRFICLALAATCPVPGMAQDSTAADYSAHGESPGSFAFVLGNGSAAVNAKWPGGVLSWYYNPSGQPADLSTDQVVATIQRAMGHWSDVCNIVFPYQGVTTTAPRLDATFDVTDRITVLGWGPLTGTRAQFSGYTSFWYLNSGSMIDADMVINTTFSPPFSASRLSELEALYVHEVGHMLGIMHSDKVQSVMYANPYHSYKFQRDLRGDDAAACARIYGASTHANTNRLFNWAEVTYEPYFAPVGGVSAELDGYLYRYYPTTRSYLGAKDGTVYILLPGSDITSVGREADFLPQAVNAGF